MFWFSEGFFSERTWNWIDEDVGKIWKDLGEGKEYDQTLYKKGGLVILKIKGMRKNGTFGT